MSESGLFSEPMTVLRADGREDEEKEGVSCVCMSRRRSRFWLWLRKHPQPALNKKQNRQL